MTVAQTIRSMLENPPLIDMSSEEFDDVPPLPSPRLLPEERQHMLTLPISETLLTLLDVFLHSSDRIVGSRAYDALVTHPAIDPVIFVTDLYERYHLDICQELGDIADHRALTLLCKILLDDSDPNFRCGAAEILGHVGDATTLPHVAYASQNDHAVDYGGIPVAKAAAHAMNQIQARLTQSTADQRL